MAPLVMAAVSCVANAVLIVIVVVLSVKCHHLRHQGQRLHNTELTSSSKRLKEFAIEGIYLAIMATGMSGLVTPWLVRLNISKHV